MSNYRFIFKRNKNMNQIELKHKFSKFQSVNSLLIKLSFNRATNIENEYEKRLPFELNVTTAWAA